MPTDAESNSKKQKRQKGSLNKTVLCHKLLKANPHPNLALRLKLNRVLSLVTMMRGELKESQRKRKSVRQRKRKDGMPRHARGLMQKKRKKLLKRA